MSEQFAQTNSNLPAKFPLAASGLRLERRTQPGSFYDVVGRKSALLGYEHRTAEAWVYPLKVLDDFDLGFRIEGYNREYSSRDLLVKIEALPEATIFTYSHAAFTVRKIIFAPIDEPAIVVLLDVDSHLPMTISAQFKPKLRLMWLAGSMTPSIGFNEARRYYTIVEESGRFASVVGSPLAREVSLMPYQEEPEDVPARFIMETSPENLRKNFVPIVITGSANSIQEARDAYDRVLNSIPALYEKNAAYYRRLNEETVSINTPDERLNRAFSWAKIGVDKGVATNPFLGTGLLAGFRTSGDSERPGFAWFFGRDALWTSFATNSYGDFKTSRTALEFLRKFQREDGKIPHEISQSATFVEWFKNYPYAWAAADATPLYIIACKDYWRYSGDADFLKASWDSLQKAYRYTAASDTDGNGLVENTNYGHGWVEGGDLYPPHEEIYQQGVWFAAARAMNEMAQAMNDQNLSAEAAARAEKVRQATEKTFWLADRNFYAYATKLPTENPVQAEPGGNRERRQARLNELAKARLFDENTVLPAVPMWFRTLPDENAQKHLDEIGSSKIATDWGARILASDSRLYDPLSYHYGSVWGLFTGWASLAAYNYGRPHVGFQALYANAQLKEQGNALGYITELLSGDFNAPFGRSSHHQIWSEAMIVTPVVRGLFGVEILENEKTLRFAPAFPADWNTAEIKNIAFENARLSASISHINGKLTVNLISKGQSSLQKIVVAPAFPLNAKIKNVSVNGKQTRFDVQKAGDIQRAAVSFSPQPNSTIVFELDEGTEVFYKPELLQPAQRNEGLKILRDWADDKNLHLILEGLGGKTYRLGFVSGGFLGSAENVRVTQFSSGFNRPTGEIEVTFSGAPNVFTRREITLSITR